MKKDVYGRCRYAIQNLFVNIFARGISQWLKQSLPWEYITKDKKLVFMRGKLGIHGTIEKQISESNWIGKASEMLLYVKTDGAV